MAWFVENLWVSLALKPREFRDESRFPAELNHPRVNFTVFSATRNLTVVWPIFLTEEWQLPFLCKNGKIRGLKSGSVHLHRSPKLLFPDDLTNLGFPFDICRLNEVI